MLYGDKMSVCNACAIFADQYIDYSGDAHRSSPARPPLDVVSGQGRWAMFTLSLIRGSIVGEQLGG
jgi:hypothetical protein